MNSFPFPTSRYGMIQGLYWASYCMTISFTSVYLLSMNYNNSEIGLILALVNIFAFFLQPFMASFIDKTSKISLKNYICLLTCVILAFSFLLWIFSNVKWAAVLSMILAFGILVSIQPLINSICFTYEKAGIPINYGIARGIGSGTYAVVSIILGNVIGRIGAGMLPVFYMVSLVLFLSAVFTFSPGKPGNSGPKHVKYFKNTESDDSLPRSRDVTLCKSLTFWAFLKKYKTFCVFILGSSLVLAAHLLICTFMIQVVSSIGGGSAEMGTSAFISAMMEIPVMFAFVKLKEKFRCDTLLKTAAIIYTVKHLLTFLCTSIPLFYASQLLQVGGFGLYIPASVYYVDQIIDKDDLVKGQAMVTGAMTLGNILASLMGGILLDYLNVKSMLFVGVILSVIGSILIISAINAINGAKRAAIYS